MLFSIICLSRKFSVSCKRLFETRYFSATDWKQTVAFSLPTILYKNVTTRWIRSLHHFNPTPCKDLLDMIATSLPLSLSFLAVPAWWKTGAGLSMKKIVTQLRHEEFQCPAPSSENGPPLPDLGAFKAGLLSTASVLVTANDGAPPRTDRGSAERDSFRLGVYGRNIVLLRVRY